MASHRGRLINEARTIPHNFGKEALDLEDGYLVYDIEDESVS